MYGTVGGGNVRASFFDDSEPPALWAISVFLGFFRDYAYKDRGSYFFLPEKKKH